MELQLAQKFYRKYLTGETHGPETGVVVLFQVAVLDQKTKDRGRGIPDGDAAFRNGAGKRARVLSFLVVNEDQRCAVTDRQVNVEYGEIEVERRMRGETVGWFGGKGL